MIIITTHIKYLTCTIVYQADKHNALFLSKKYAWQWGIMSQKRFPNEDEKCTNVNYRKSFSSLSGFLFAKYKERTQICWFLQLRYVTGSCLADWEK